MVWRSCRRAAYPAGWLSRRCLVLMVFHHLVDAELKAVLPQPDSSTTLVSAPSGVWDNIFKSLGDVRITSTERPAAFGKNVLQSLNHLTLSPSTSTTSRLDQGKEVERTQTTTTTTVKQPAHANEHAGRGERHDKVAFAPSSTETTPHKNSGKNPRSKDKAEWSHGDLGTIITSGHGELGEVSTVTSTTTVASSESQALGEHSRSTTPKRKNIESPTSLAGGTSRIQAPEASSTSGASMDMVETTTTRTKIRTTTQIYGHLEKRMETTLTTSATTTTTRAIRNRAIVGSKEQAPITTTGATTTATIGTSVGTTTTSQTFGHLQKRASFSADLTLTSSATTTTTTASRTRAVVALKTRDIVTTTVGATSTSETTVAQTTVAATIMETTVASTTTTITTAHTHGRARKRASVPTETTSSPSATTIGTATRNGAIVAIKERDIGTTTAGVSTKSTEAIATTTMKTSTTKATTTKPTTTTKTTTTTTTLMTTTSTAVTTTPTTSMTTTTSKEYAKLGKVHRTAPPAFNGSSPLLQRPTRKEYCVASGREDGQAGAPECSRLIQTNCSTAEGAATLCPAECPYLELGAYAACGSACVAAEQCGDYRPAFAFANPATRVCEPCPHQGCAACNETHCLSCREGFVPRLPGEMFVCRVARRICLSRSLPVPGRSLLAPICNSSCILSPHVGKTICVYDQDDMLEPVYYWIACGGAFILFVLLCMWLCCCHNSTAIKAGMKHRSRCLVRPANDERDAPLYSLFTNLHRQNIVGIGLALYYNQLAFVALVASFAWSILYVADLAYSIYGLVDSGGEYFDFQKFVLSGGIQIRRESCSYTEDDQQRDAIIYAWRRAFVSLVLWLVTFPASVFFARYQLLASKAFDTDDKHMFMEDFVVLAKGFPPSVVDPLPIQRWIEGILGRTVVGVSISYDFYSKRKEINALLDHHIQRREREYSEHSGEEGDFLDSDYAITPDAIVRGGVENLLQDLRSTGDAFIVLRKEGDNKELFETWERRSHSAPRLESFFDFTGHSLNKSLDLTYPPELLPHDDDGPSLDFQQILPDEARSYAIHLREVTSEPTSIEWPCLGFTRKHIRVRAIVASLIFIASIVAFNILLYYPLIRYVLRFSRKAGQIPSTAQTLLLGSIIGAGNSLISNVIHLGVPMLGFKRKDQKDVVVFLLRTLLVLWNSVVLTCITCMKFAAIANPEHGILKGISDSLEISEMLGREAALAKALFSLFVSGTFVVPSLGGIIQSPALLIKDLFLIRSGLLGRRLSARECEKILEPMEMWLPWDYASHIQLPCCAFLPLFFSEPIGDCAARVLCAVLVCWCAVEYSIQRIIHLRASKETFFSTDRLDRAAIFMFALPVAMLLHLTAYWTIRATQLVVEVNNVKQATLVWVMSFPANMLGGFLYFQCVKRAMKKTEVMDSSSRVPKTYTDALSQLKYSYFNTNPVYVLMSDYLGIWENSDSNKRVSRTTYYETGKVYLQKPPPLS